MEVRVLIQTAVWDSNNFIIFHVSSFCTVGQGRQGKGRRKRGKKGREESRYLFDSSVFLDKYKEQSGLINSLEDRSSHCTVCLSQTRPIHCSSAYLSTYSQWETVIWMGSQLWTKNSPWTPSMTPVLWSNVLPCVHLASHRGEGQRKKKKKKDIKKSSSSTFFRLQGFSSCKRKANGLLFPLLPVALFLSVNPINFNTLVLLHIPKFLSHFWCLLVTWRLTRGSRT